MVNLLQCTSSRVQILLTKAMHAKGADYFQPFDLDRDPKCNILDDSAFAILLRLAWSGLIGAVWSAPPCKEYSRLKLRPGGPKALRTPEHMGGVPGLTEDEQRRVDQSKAIHDRGKYCKLHFAPQHREDSSNRPAAWPG